MTPSLASRPAFLACWASPFLRRMAMAASTLPLASTRAFLQSIIPAFVISRSFLTSSGEMLLSPSGEEGAVVVMGVAVVDMKLSEKAATVIDRRYSLKGD